MAALQFVDAPPPAMAEASVSPWWNPIDLRDGPRWMRLGALTTWVQAEGSELLVATQLDQDAERDDVEEGIGAPPGAAETRRFATLAPPTRVSLRPRLVDRALVVRPRVSLALPPGVQVELFMTAPLNVAVVLDGATLDERPIGILASTWFGPSPVRGELCYASRTRGVRAHETPDVPPTRCVTRVILDNRGRNTMEVARVRLPLRRLTLAWSAQKGHLVTESVRLRRGVDNEGEVSVEALPAGVEVLAEPADEGQPVWRNALAALWN